METFQTVTQHKNPSLDSCSQRLFVSVLTRFFSNERSPELGTVDFRQLNHSRPAQSSAAMSFGIAVFRIPRVSIGRKCESAEVSFSDLGAAFVRLRLLAIFLFSRLLAPRVLSCKTNVCNSAATDQSQSLNRISWKACIDITMIAAAAVALVATTRFCCRAQKSPRETAPLSPLAPQFQFSPPCADYSAR
jgi:hypothetical protein